LLREWSPTDLNPPPLLTGHDLMQLGIKPGPLYKTILERVREAQLDGTIHTREEAIALAKSVYNQAPGSAERFLGICTPRNRSAHPGAWCHFRVGCGGTR